MDEELTEEELLSIYKELNISGPSAAAIKKLGFSFEEIALEWYKIQNKKLLEETEDLLNENT